MTARPLRTVAAVLALLALALAPTGAATAPASEEDRYAAVVEAILAEPYQPAYVPAGFDGAFGSQNVLNTLPAQDYTTGSVPGNPDHPEWPAAFQPVTFASADGAPLFGRLALHSGERPGIVVVHGFNTNGKESVIRWAAMLFANGYNVLAADARSFRASFNANREAALRQPQTFGWKESEDVIAAGGYLAAQPGVGSIGVVGFSLGGQDTVLALAMDARAGTNLFAAGLNFSGPADQNTQIYSTAAPPDCRTDVPPGCSYPATQALAILVVPPHDTGNPCTILDRARAAYGTTPYEILAQENAFHRQTFVDVPLLNVYAQDDPLVLPFHATMMAGYEGGNALQRTLLIEQGAHAYFYDRWWQQRATLLYFKALLPDAADLAIGVQPTVNQTPGGTPVGTQLVPLGSPSRSEADSHLAPFICDTTQPPPGGGGVAGRGASTTGGGWLADDSGGKVNFGFDVEEIDAAIEGELELRDKAAGVKIAVTTITSVGTVGFGCGSVPGSPASLELRGTGTFNGVAGASFRVCVQDNGEGRGAVPDLFYLACTGGCSYDTGSRTPDDGIEGGNIHVRSAGGAAAESGADEPATVILDPVLLTEAAASTQAFSVRVFDANGEALAGAPVSLTRTTGSDLPLTVSALTDAAGKAVIVAASVAGAEYRATAGTVESNAVELSALLP